MKNLNKTLQRLVDFDVLTFEEGRNIIRGE